MADLKPNAELAYKVLDHIDAHPESWKQGTWWCGTSGCFAGWAYQLATNAGIPEGHVVRFGGQRLHIAEAAARLLGFASNEAMDDAALALLHPGMEWEDVDFDEPGNEVDLFSAGNSRVDLGRLVEAIFGPRPDGGA